MCACAVDDSATSAAASAIAHAATTAKTSPTWDPGKRMKPGKVSSYLHRRPGYGPGGGRFGEAPSGVQHSAKPALQHPDLGRHEQPTKRLGQTALLDVDQSPLDVAAQVLRQRL